MPAVGAGVVPGSPAVGVEVVAGGEGTPLGLPAVGAGVDPDVGAGVVPGVPDVGAGVTAGLWTGVGELTGTAPGDPEGTDEAGVPGVSGDGLAGAAVGLGGDLMGVKVNVTGVDVSVLVGAATGELTGDVAVAIGDDPDCTGGEEGEGLASVGLEVGRGGVPAKPGLKLVLGLRDLPGVALGGGRAPGEVGTDVLTGVGLLPVGAGDASGTGGKGTSGVGTFAS